MVYEYLMDEEEDINPITDPATESIPLTDEIFEVDTPKAEEEEEEDEDDDDEFVEDDDSDDDDEEDPSEVED